MKVITRQWLWMFGIWSLSVLSLFLIAALLRLLLKN
jgi:Protein of unknown function (DUF2474)